MRKLVLVLIALLAFCSSAAADSYSLQTQTFSIVNNAGIPHSTVQVWEDAAKIDSEHMQYWWFTPTAQFGPGGWPIYIGHYNCGGCGWHTVGSNGLPALYVDAVSDPRDAVSFTHEVLESLEDPYGGNPEVCDPLEGDDGYLRNLDGYSIVWIAKFIRP